MPAPVPKAQGDSLTTADLNRERIFTFDPTSSGGGPDGPFCASCNAPITGEQRSIRINFNSRALSAHRTQQSYVGYAKRTESACSRPPGSGTHTGWRTKWRQTFRMSSRKPFRMNSRNKV